MDGLGFLAEHGTRFAGLFLSCLAVAPLMPRGIHAAVPRYHDAEGFVRGTARGIEPVPGGTPTDGAEAATRACLDALAGPRGADAFVRAALNAQREFHLTPEQQERFRACLERAGYRTRLPPPLPPGAKRFD